KRSACPPCAAAPLVARSERGQRRPGARLVGARGAARSFRGAAVPRARIPQCRSGHRRPAGAGGAAAARGAPAGRSRHRAGGGALIEKGKLAELEELQKNTPKGELVRIDGVGPKSAELMWKKLGIGTIEQLEEAARAGRLRELPRFSEKREQKILRGIEAFRR